MTQQLEYTFNNSSSTDPFDDLWEETRAKELVDEDECDYDIMDDKDDI